MMMTKVGLRTFVKVDLEKWVDGTIEKHENGESWNHAWFATYCNIGGQSEQSGEKACPKVAANTLYRFGRIKNSGVRFKPCERSRVWPCYKNGTYAILATRMLRDDRDLSKASLWKEVRRAVLVLGNDELAGSDQGASRLAFQLGHLGLIVDMTPHSPTDKGIQSFGCQS